MKKEKPKKNYFFVSISIIVFICLVCVLLFFYALNILDYTFKFINLEAATPITTLSILLVMSLGFGVAISILVGKNISRPIEDIKKATTEIAKGNFDIKVPNVKNKTINEIIDNFNKMAEELKSIETLKSDFISNVSHEFKTPLSIIQTYTKAISKPSLDDDTKKRYLEVIDNNVKKLTNLTQNILSLSKLDNQCIEIEKSSFWLDEEIRQCILLLETKWKAKNLNLNINLDKVKYFGARDLISQVWQNLLDNAIKFSNPGGQISVSLKTQNNQIVAIVADSGVGIPAQNLPRIFDKFYQADTSRSSSGNGLGLALVKRIVESLEGTISVSSEENQGTTVRIEFKKD